MELSVSDVEERSRYEITADGAPAGLATYRRDGDVTTFLHTETDPALGGQGIGSALVKAALDDVRSSGGRVVAVCRFVAGYVDRHPEYADLLTDS